MRTTTKTALLLMAMTIASHAIPITVTPSSGFLGSTRWVSEDNVTSQSVINGLIDGFVEGGISGKMLYSYEVEGKTAAEELGELLSSYESDLPPEANGGTISYEGGYYVGPTAYLLVKDGNHTPSWYFFNLTALKWTGTDTLTLSGFWPNGGAISHVSLYATETNGGTGTPPGTIPDGGTTLLLLGSALTGLGVLRRKFGAKIG